MADEVQREVERRDGGHNPHGHADGEAKLVDNPRGGVQRYRLSVEALSFFSGQGDGLDGSLDLGTAFGDDFTLFAGDSFSQVVGPLFHEVSGALENRVSAVGGQFGHHGRAAHRTGNGSLHVGG